MFKINISKEIFQKFQNFKMETGKILNCKLSELNYSKEYLK